MKSLSLAFLKNNLSKTGGLEKYTVRLIDAFQKRGHEVVLLTSEHIDKPKKEFSFPVVYVCKHLPLSLLRMAAHDFFCHKYLKEKPVDAVFGLDRNLCSQHYYRAGNGVHAAFLEKRKLFSSSFKTKTLKFNPLHRLILRAEKKTYESPHLKRLFTNSDLVKVQIQKHYPKVDPQKITVIHNGVEWQEMEPAFDESLVLREKIQEKLGLNPKCFQFLFVGNEYKRKGLLLLLQALACLKETNYQLSIVGKDRDLPFFARLVQELNLQERVLFFGERESVSPFYQAADVLVVPTFYDPFANVTLEAWAMGLYVITSQHNGAKELITSDTVGCVFDDEHAIDSLAHALKEALNRHKDKESAIAIRSAFKDYDFTQQIGKIVSSVEQDYS